MEKIKDTVTEIASWFAVAAIFILPLITVAFLQQYPVVHIITTVVGIIYLIISYCTDWGVFLNFLVIPFVLFSCIILATEYLGGFGLLLILFFLIFIIKKID